MDTENTFIKRFGWSVIEISNLIFFKNHSLKWNDTRNAPMSHLIQQPQIILIIKSQI